MTRGRSRRGSIGAVFLLGSAALGVVQFYRPTRELPAAPFVHLRAALAPAGLPAATPTPDAFGRSGEVKVRFTLPGQPVEFPLAIAGSADSLSYEWMSVTDSSIAGPAQPLRSAFPTPPSQPGFYRLVLIKHDARQVIAEPALAVMVPFDRKLGQWLNGYLIGEYLAERIEGKHKPPRGFVEVHPGMEHFQLSTHLTLGDFITHDEQVNVWPKYVAVDPLLLDKVELILSAVGSTARADVDVDVHSAFRSPAYNRTVKRAARDSRHQYGDAADIQIDANGDGRIDLTDEVLVMLAIEKVEDAHPELVGGLGIYTSRRYRTPYLHIDTRGKRSVWRG